MGARGPKFSDSRSSAWPMSSAPIGNNYRRQTPAIRDTARGPVCYCSARVLQYYYCVEESSPAGMGRSKAKLGPSKQRSWLARAGVEASILRRAEIKRSRADPIRRCGPPSTEWRNVSRLHVGRATVLRLQRDDRFCRLRRPLLSP